MKKLLLDECLPRKFKNYFPNCECLTVPEAGLAGRSNGELLSLAEAADVQVFLTLDQGIEYQQNLSRRHIAVICSPTSFKPFGGPYPTRPQSPRGAGVHTAGTTGPGASLAVTAGYFTPLSGSHDPCSLRM